MVSQILKIKSLKTLIFGLALLCSLNLMAQVPPCDPMVGNKLIQINTSPVTVDINNACKALVPDMLGRWLATPGPGYELISVVQAPSSSTILTLNGAEVCPEGQVTVTITAIFFYFGNPTDPSDDVLCSLVGTDYFLLDEEIPPSFVNFNDMTISVTTDCVIDGVDVLPLLKKANVKDNCTSKDYLIASAYVTQCDMLPPPGECPAQTRCWTFHITDACGNTAEKDINVTVTENVPPVITLPASFTVNANSSCLITDAQLKALVTAANVSDNCTSDATLLNNLQVSYGGGSGCIAYNPGDPMVVCPTNPFGKYCYTFITTDACGNTSNPEVVTIYVKDVTAPVLIPPSDFSICWPDINYPFQNFTSKPTVVEGCNADCNITCIIYSQRILALTNPPRGAYGNNVYPTISINPGPRVATIRVCAQDLCGNGVLNPPLPPAAQPSNCCIFNVTINYNPSCAPPPLAKFDDGKVDSQGKLEVVSPETGHVDVDKDQDLYLGAFPNPFKDFTSVYFNLSENEEYNMMLYTFDGKQVFHKTGKGLQGRNVVTLEKSKIGVNQMMYCTVETKETRQTIILLPSN